jgi:hypothetical protein
MTKIKQLYSSHQSRAHGQYSRPASEDRQAGVWSWLGPMFVLALLAVGVPLLAQAPHEDGRDRTSSSIQGVVTVKAPNTESTTMEGITVNLRGLTPGAENLAALTDAEGHYELNQLSAGRYQLEARVEGFQPFSQTLLLGSGELRVANVVLQIGVVVQEVDVHDTAPQVATEAAASPLRLTDQQFQALPLAEQKFKEALPLVPGVVRTRDGQLNMKGEVENQGMLLVNSAQTVDPVTGSFSIPVPLDAIQTLQVEKTPYDAEYGGFSGGLTSIETKPPSSQWKYGVMDFIPGIRGKSGHIVGLSDETPRLFFGGPLIKDKLNFSEAAFYDFKNKPVRGLPWPHNETQMQGFASLSSFQAVLSPQHLLSMNVNAFSNRDRYADISSLVPQPASSNDGQRGVSIGATDSYQFRSGGVLSTLFRYTRFDGNAYGQGANDMLITPEGWGGNFFNRWTRTSNQFEFLPVYRFPIRDAWGRHELKVGVDLTHRSYRVTRYSHPIQLLRQDGSLAEEIDFENNGEFPARDFEVSEFVQDHWMLNERLTADLGGRLTNQSIGRSAAFAPRAGLVYSPGEDRKTIIRAGGGLFYGRVPLLLADFADDPTRVVTLFDQSGTPLGAPIPFPTAFVQPVAGVGLVPTGLKLDTSPRNFSGNFEVDRELGRGMVLRTSYLYSQTQDLYLVTPVTFASGPFLGLANSGGSHYHEIQTTLHYRLRERSELNMSYVHSRGRGDLNTISGVYAPFEQPIIRPNYTGNFAADVPNRMVSSGTFSLPWKLTASPVVDVRTGFPYSQVNTLQNYVGVPNGERFSTFFSLDLKIYREFKVSSLPFMGRFKNQKLRLGVYSLNLTNHANYLDVYNNVASPYFGNFAGFQHRVDGLVIDMVD